MGGYPPGTGPGDPNAPWNAPDYEDLLPLVCDTCGFYAETLDDLDEHEHPEEEFRPPEPDPEPEPEFPPEGVEPPEEVVEDPGPPMVPPEALDDEEDT